MQEKIRIFVHSEYSKIPKILNVNRYDLIGEVFKNDRPFLLLYDGKALSFGFSFAFYEIREGAHLYKINSQCKDDVFDDHYKRMKIKRDLEEFRLVDTCMMKIEFNPKCYWKAIARFNESDPTETNDTKRYPCTDIGVSTKQPSTKALPSFWEE